MKLTNFSKFSFGIGALGKDLCYAIISYFLMIYFTDTVGLTLSVICFWWPESGMHLMTR